MNINIFSCTVLPLLVLETQITHPEPLQSLCINRCITLAAIFFANVCAHTSACGRTCLRLHAPLYVRPHLSTLARTCVRALYASVDLGLTRRLH